LLQESVHHLSERDPFLGGVFRQVGLDIWAQVDRQADHGAGAEKLAAFAFAEIILGLHLVSS
jgi:hypothetical protein